MSEQIYTIKKSSLDELATQVKSNYDYWSDKNITIPEIINEIEYLRKVKDTYDEITNGSGGSPSVLYLSRDISDFTNISNRYSKYYTSIEWQLPREKEVTSLEKAFSNSYITTLTLPDFVCSDPNGLGAYIADNCIFLTEVYWNLPVKTVGNYSFYKDTNLKKVIFSEATLEKLTRLGQYCFQGCNKLTSINLIFPNLTTIGDYCFYGNSKLSIDTLELHPDVNIGESAFYGTVIKKLVAPLSSAGFNSDQLGTGSFESIKELKEIDFSGATEVNLRAGRIFRNSGIEDIQGIEKINTVGVEAFADCPLKDGISFPNIRYLYAKAFAGLKKCTELELESSLVTLGEAPFATRSTYDWGSDSTLTTLILPAHLIHRMGLFKDSSITRLKFKGTKEEWCNLYTNSDTFTSDWPLMKSRTNSDGTITYGQLYVKDENGNFYELKGTSEAPLKLDMEEIKRGVFYGYKNLGYVEFPQQEDGSTPKISTIGADAFKEAAAERINYYGGQEKWASIDFENEYSNPLISNPVLYCLNKSNVLTKMPAFVDSWIKEDIDVIKKYTFVNTSLTQISFTRYGDSLTLEEGCFMGSTIMTSLLKKSNANVYIKDRVFKNCIKLKYITGFNPTTPAQIVEIGNEAFSGCTALDCGGAGIPGPLTLPYVKTIGNQAFKNCSALPSVVLGSEGRPVEQVGEDAFDKCTSMTDLTVYTNDQSMVDSQTIPDSWGIDSNITTNINIYYTEATTEV